MNFFVAFLAAMCFGVAPVPATLLLLKLKSASSILVS